MLSGIHLKLYKMHDSLLSNKANEDILTELGEEVVWKEICGATSSGSTALLSADGSTRITNENEVLERWAEHFDRLLNHPTTINDRAIERSQ